MRILAAVFLLGAAHLTMAQSALTDTLEAIIEAVPEATVAVAVRDAETGTTVDIRTDHVFHAASTMKVPVMIEVYRRMEQGRLGLEDTLTVRNAFRSIVDGSIYSIEDDSDDAIYEKLGQPMTIGELVHQMMSVSSNLATNLLIDELIADTIQQTVNQLDAPGMKVLRGVEDLKAYDRGLSNSTTARALATLLTHLCNGTAVSPSADSAMVATMLLSEFNEMIPAGLPANTRVANKTGWITRIHHDAAIVLPAASAPYVLVILAGGLDDHDASAALGASLARTVHAYLRPAAQ